MSELQVTVIIGPTNGTGQSIIATGTAKLGGHRPDRAGLLSYYAHEVTRDAVRAAGEVDGWKL